MTKMATGLETRVMHYEDLNGCGETYTIETRGTVQPEWDVDTAYCVADGRISAGMLIRLAWLNDLGIPVSFEI